MNFRQEQEILSPKSLESPAHEESTPTAHGTDFPMKRSPLHEQHMALHATFREVAGWEVPLHYGNPEEEHAAVRQAVGISDLSQRGRLRITGEDRTTWLQSLTSNDVLSAAPGTGIYSSLLTHKGKMLTYFRAYPTKEAIFLEDVGDIGETTFQALRKFLLYGTKAKMENLAETWGLLLVSGPRASTLLQEALQIDTTTLAPLAFLETELNGHQALILRTEETGETDLEICIPTDGLLPVWEQLLKGGGPLGLKPCGAQARETLRIEAGIPLAGVDLTEEIVPPEANLEGKAFSLNKGCYPGQEVVARMDTYGSVRRRMVGLIIKNATPPPPHSKIFSEDREVGWISSSTYSPMLTSPIALGFPLRDFTTPGTELTIDMEGTRHEATVHALPFVTTSSVKDSA